MTNQAETGDTGVTLTTIEPSIEPPKNHHYAKLSKATLLARPGGVSEQTWSDWLQLRKTLKAAVTQTAVDGIAREATLAGYSLEQALVTCCTNGWRGFKAGWVQRSQPVSTHAGRAPLQSFAQQDREEGMRRWEEMTGQVHPDRQQRQGLGGVIDVTARDAGRERERLEWQQ